MINKTIDFDSIRSNKMDRRAGWYESDNGRAIGFPRIEVVQEANISTMVLGEPSVRCNFQASNLGIGDLKFLFNEFEEAITRAIILAETWDLDTGRLCLWGALEEAYK